MRSRAIVVGALFGAAVVSGDWMVRQGLAGTERTSAGARLFDQVVERVATNYVDSLPPSELYARAVDGLLGELGDPHSLYLTDERLARLNEQTSGSYDFTFDEEGTWEYHCSVHGPEAMSGVVLVQGG